jgi:hypothetical protein
MVKSKLGRVNQTTNGWKHSKTLKKSEKVSSLKEGNFSRKHKKVNLNFT